MSHSRFQRYLAMSIACIFSATLTTFAQSYGTRRVTQTVDDSKTVALKGHVIPFATEKNDRGAVEDNMVIDHIQLVLQRSPEAEQALNELMEQQNDSNSANYHKWLSAADFGDRFGVSQGDIDAVTSWLQSQGFHVNQVYPGRTMIDFGGTARQIREGLHTSMHHIDVNGERHISNMSAPQIPAALASVVRGIASLNDIKPKAMHKKHLPQYTFTGTHLDYAVTPQDNQTIYHLNPLYNAGVSGQGQTIYIVEDTDTYSGSGDWNSYRSTFGLSTAFPQGSYTQTHPGAPSACTDPGTNGDDGEAAIDVEVASAVAPSAAIQLISCAGGAVTFGGQIALQNLINQTNVTPGVVSVSYGVCEAINGQGGNAAFYNTYQQAAAEGFSVFVSSGDEGPSSCSNLFTAGSQYDIASLGVTGWGETPYNVTVGGTDFEDAYIASQGGVPQSTYWSATNTAGFGSALSYIPEIPWNDACASVLLSKYLTGSFVPYGASPATCNNSKYDTSTTYLSTGAASGGASNCAIGAAGTTQTSSADTGPECQGYPKPSWQSGSSLPGGVAVYGVPSDGVRDIPDVSMFAANGVWGHYEVVCWSDPAYTSDGSASCSGAPSTWSGFGGTSVAAPTMAAVQALINQKTGQVWGNPNPIYYKIAQAAYGSNGGSFQGAGCNSSTGNPQGCAFNDVTQGDIDLACEYNATATEHHCYKPTGTHGVDSTDNVTAATVINGGTGYTTAPTCAIAGPTNNQPYLSPTGTTLYAGGTQASCAATVNAGSTTAVWKVQVAAGPSTSWQSGISAFTIGGTTYTMYSSLSGVTTPNAVLYTITGSASSQETAAAKNIEAAINNNSAQCSAAPCFANLTGANSLATAAETTSTVTLTAKAGGYAGNFTAIWGNGFVFGAGDVAITNTTIGQGPNYVSGITITTAGSGYQPDTPITLTGVGNGAVAIANTSPGTAAQSYQPAYGAANGYDLATGLGSPNASVLACSTAWGISQQTINWAQQGPYTPGQSPVALTATATSGLPVTYTLVSGPGSINNGVLSFTGLGNIVIQATQNGNTSYCAAPVVTQTIVVAKADQTINVTTLPTNVMFGAGPYAVSATSGLPVTLGVTGPATLSNGVLTITGVGSVVVTASQAGNSNYNAAPTVVQTIVVSKADQTITISGIPATANFGSSGPYTVTASSTSGLPATLSVSGPATLKGSTLTLTGVGTVTVTATQAGNANYNPATKVQTIVVGSITLTASGVISGNASTGYSLLVTVKNTGTGTAANVQLTTATLGTTNGSGLPASLGSIAGGGSASVAISFPGSTGSDGAAVAEKLAGTFTGGTFTGSFRAQLP